MPDDLKWHAALHIDKYSEEQTADIAALEGIDISEVTGEHFAKYEMVPADTQDIDGNLLVTVGLAAITNVLIGSGQAMTATRTGIGVGSTATTAVIGDTHLGADGSAANGTTGAWYSVVDSAPTHANGVLTFICTFTAVSNNAFAWAEWCIFTATGTITAGDTLASTATGTIMINHKIQSLGTKTSGAAWVLTATITLS
jgi:hypothetical protein